MLQEIWKEKGTVELSYMNGRYWCKLLHFDARDGLTDMRLNLDINLRIVSHMRDLDIDFQDAKVVLHIGGYTMLADVGEITCKRQKDKSYHYDIELNWS